MDDQHSNSHLHDDLFSDDPVRQLGVLTAMSMLTPAAMEESDLCRTARLIELTDSESHDVRCGAAEILETGFPVDPAELRAISNLLRTHDCDDAGYWAATLLGRLATSGSLGSELSSAVESLEDCLRHSDYTPAMERAAWALGRIGQPASEAMPTLRAIAEDAPPRLRRLAIEALESIRGIAA